MIRRHPFVALFVLSLSLVFPAHISASLARPAPPDTWKEHWYEHKQLLHRVYVNDDVAIYFDDDMDRVHAPWINAFMTRIWRYTKQTYKIDLGADPHLYAVFHVGKYLGGHPSPYYDGSHDYRNTVDMGQPYWAGTLKGWSMDGPSHEVGHIVEFASHGAQGSPSFRLWGDSKWIEIYQYDLYLAFGLKASADRLYSKFSATSDDFPRRGTHWFRDWYYPIYRHYGRTRVLTDYFALLARYFPKNARQYSRDLNWGEYFWFMSGAARVDLQPLAANAFGWSREWELQFKKAQKDFPQISVLLAKPRPPAVHR